MHEHAQTACHFVRTAMAAHAVHVGVSAPHASEIMTVLGSANVEFYAQLSISFVLRMSSVNVLQTRHLANLNDVMKPWGLRSLQAGHHNARRKQLSSACAEQGC